MATVTKVHFEVQLCYHSCTSCGQNAPCMRTRLFERVSVFLLVYLLFTGTSRVPFAERKQSDAAPFPTARGSKRTKSGRGADVCPRTLPFTFLLQALLCVALLCYTDLTLM